MNFRSQNVSADASGVDPILISLFEVHRTAFQKVCSVWCRPPGSWACLAPSATSASPHQSDSWYCIGRHESSWSPIRSQGSRFVYPSVESLDGGVFPRCLVGRGGLVVGRRAHRARRGPTHGLIIPGCTQSSNLGAQSESFQNCSRYPLLTSWWSRIYSLVFRRRQPFVLLIEPWHRRVAF